MKVSKNLNQNMFFLLLSALMVFFCFVGRVAADHSTPERVVENKYTVVLLMLSEEEQMKLRFLFRDVHTGKNIVVPIVWRISIVGDKKEGETSNGIIEFPYTFPSGGLYEVSLEFEKADEAGKVYRPDTWTVWVPGQTKSFFQRYPIGRAEIAGFLSFFGALGVIVFSVWFKRAKGETLELSFFGIFGSEKSKDRRMSFIKQERQSARERAKFP